METTAESTITIKLTADEAEWLKGLVQNPIGVRYPQDEQPRDRKMRKVFWDALNFPKG